MSQQQRIARNTFLAIIGVAGAGIVRFIFTLVTGRAFGAATLGVVAVVVAVATISTIPVAGVAAAGNRYLAVASGADDRVMRRETLGSTWRGALALSGLAIIASWLYLELQAVPIDEIVLWVGLGFVAAYGAYLASKGILFGDGKAAQYAVGEIVGFGLFVAMVLIVVMSGISAGWILASQIAWTAGVIGFAIRAGVGPTFSRRSAPRGLWPFATTASIGSLLSLGLTQATVLVMSAVHGSEGAGLLAAAVALTAPLYLLPRGLSLALTPSMSFHVGAGSQSRANLDTTYTTTLLVLFGGLSAASIVAFDGFILALYGEGFQEATKFVSLFAVASFIAISGIPVVNRYASQGSKALLVPTIGSGVGAGVAAAIWVVAGAGDPLWIPAGFLIATFIKVIVPFAASRKVIGARLIPGLGVGAFSTILLGLTLAADRYGWVVLVIGTVLSLPILYVATVRYRARSASISFGARPLRIGVVTNAYPMPGFPNYGVFVRTRVRAYERQGAQVVTVVPRRKAGIRKYGLLAWDIGWSLLTRPTPDAYEIHPVQPTGPIALLFTWIAQRPYVLYGHGADVSDASRGALYERLVERTVRSAAEIHTNSQHMADQIDARWPDINHPLVIPPGVLLIDRPITGHGDIDVLFVGNLIHRKGADILISALAQLSLSPSVVIAGGGPESHSLQEQARSRGVEARFCGIVEPDDVPALMARARLVVVPSRYEPFGQVAIEALASGTPIVVTDTGGLADIPTGSCGSVVPPGDTDLLAEAIKVWLLRDTRDESSLAKAARDRAAEFSVDRLAGIALARFQALAVDSYRMHGPHKSDKESLYRAPIE